MKNLFLFFIKVYQQVVSPILGHNCRFIPSCSEYAKEAFLLHNPLKATILTTKRILRCHPWGNSGYDPVPISKIKRIKDD